MPGARVIINAALTGAVPTRSDTPHVPITPAEIAADAARVCALGAAMVHIHARDAEGRPTWRKEVFGEIVQRIRERCGDVVIVATTTGRGGLTLEQRLDVLSLRGDARPDMASLTMGSLNFMNDHAVSPPDVIRRLLGTMLESGVRPECEIFDMGMADFTRHLHEKGLLPAPLYANLLLGSLGTMAATPANLVHLAAALPPGAVWAGAGIGRFAFLVHGLALAMGAHVRAGIEDSLYMDEAKRELATNEALVRRVRDVARVMGRELAPPAEARCLLGLSSADPSAGETQSAAAH